MFKNSKLLLCNKKLLNKRINLNKIQQPNEIFRVICEENISYFQNSELPVIKKNNSYEAVLIEFRCFPHLEFLIRNTMIKLGDKWSHTVICSNLNYDFMITMCANISSEITVIKTDYDNLNQSTYNLMLASKVFWELFAGEKILLYQEDSCIFKSNINDFMQWDYIGAPWPKHQNDSSNGVGNGRFSLRTRQCMLDVIDKVSIYDTKIETSTLEYMQNTEITICQENIYFSKNMQDYGIGKVADWDSSYAFCTESIYNENSFGGNNFWMSNKKWKEKIYMLIPLNYYKNIIINTYTNDIISYDMFDTLIFRYCNVPHLIFNIIQESVGNPDFKLQRCNAESIASKSHKNINIDTIYDTMKILYNYDDNTINYYKNTEIETEINNIYPNNELFLKLKENDIIVSDMYLSEQHLRTILKKCVKHNRDMYDNTLKHVNIDKVKIYVSYNGKSDGWIWDIVQEKKIIKYHIGDNYHSDYSMVNKYGLNAIKYKGTSYSDMEKYLITNDNLNLANLCRFTRLLNPYIENTPEYIIYNSECNINIPILLLTCKYLNGLNKKLLFNLRDCYYMKIFYDILYPDNNNSHFLNSSRNAYKNVNEEYIEYMNTMISDNSIIIDVQGTGNSIFKFIELYISDKNKNIHVFYVTASSKCKYNKNLKYFVIDSMDVLIETLNINYLNSFIKLKNGISYRLKDDCNINKYKSIYYPIIQTIHKIKNINMQKYLNFKIEYIDALYNKNNFFGNSKHIKGISYLNKYLEFIETHIVTSENLFPINNTKMNLIIFYTLGDPYDKGLNLSIEGKIFENIYTPYVDNVCVYNTQKCLELNEKFSSEYLQTYPNLNKCEHSRGCNMGFLKWKPYIIKHQLEQIADNEILIYHDCNITRYSYYMDSNTFRENIDFIFKKTGLDIIIPIERPDLLCKHHCKKEVFDTIGINNDDYRNFPLLNANRIFIKKTKLSCDFINDWLYYCNYKDLILPENKEQPDLRWHTHDQAILTVLYKKYINDDKLPKNSPGFYLKDKILSKETIIFL